MRLYARRRRFIDPPTISYDSESISRRSFSPRPRVRNPRSRFARHVFRRRVRHFSDVTAFPRTRGYYYSGSRRRRRRRRRSVCVQTVGECNPTRRRHGSVRSTRLYGVNIKKITPPPPPPIAVKQWWWKFVVPYSGFADERIVRAPWESMIRTINNCIRSSRV